MHARNAAHLPEVWHEHDENSVDVPGAVQAMHCVFSMTAVFDTSLHTLKR